MTTMNIQKDNKGNITQIIVKDVTFYYTCVKRPVPIFDDRKLPYEKARKEYKTTIAVSEDVADQWDEIFGKQPSQKWLNSKFIENYKLEDASELPFPDEKKQFTIKVTQKAQKKDGEPIDPRAIPKVLKVEGKKGVDISRKVNVGNGSKGTLIVRVMSNSYGVFSYLDTIAITDLVEYEDGGSGAVNKGTMDALGLDDVEMDETPVEEDVKSSGDGQVDEPPFDPDSDEDFEDEPF